MVALWLSEVRCCSGWVLHYFLMKAMTDCNWSICNHNRQPLDGLSACQKPMQLVLFSVLPEGEVVLYMIWEQSEAVLGSCLAKGVGWSRNRYDADPKPGVWPKAPLPTSKDWALTVKLFVSSWYGTLSSFLGALVTGVCIYLFLITISGGLKYIS